jgi:hypothetical protein
VLAILWRVADENLDVDSFVATFGLAPDALWHKGERRRPLAPPSPTSGFNFCVSDREPEDMGAALDDLRAFLQRSRAGLEFLLAKGVGSTLDVGVTVGELGRPTRSVRIPSADLTVLGQLGIELEVSAYVCEEEESATPEE